MARYFVANTTQVGGTVHWAGSLVADEVGDPIAELRSAGAALLPAEEPAIAVAAARATAKRLKGASEGDLTAMMLAAQAALPGRTQLIYRPGGPTAGPFFANFGELFVVAAAFMGDVEVSFDASFQDPVVVPAGDYDYVAARVGFRQPLRANVAVQWADGVRFFGGNGDGGNFELSGPIESQCLSTGQPTLELPFGSDLLLLFGASVRMAAVGPFMLVAAGAGGSEVFLFEGSGVQNPDGTGPAIEMASGAELAIILLPGSDLGAGTLAGPADSTINLIPASTGAMFSTVQPDFLGALNTQNGTNAQLLGYVPSNPADWVDPPPPDVRVAIDRLAAYLVAVNGGAPVP